MLKDKDWTVIIIGLVAYYVIMIVIAIASIVNEKPFEQLQTCDYYYKKHTKLENLQIRCYYESQSMTGAVYVSGYFVDPKKGK